MIKYLETSTKVSTYSFYLFFIFITIGKLKKLTNNVKYN